MASQNAVPKVAVFSADIGLSRNWSQRSSVSVRQMSPRPYFAMKLISSGVTFSAASVRSPSFSRSSSSTRTIIRPARISSSAVGTSVNAAEGDIVGWNYADSSKAPDGRLRVELLIHARVAHDGLHIFARFGEWNRLNELLRVAEVAVAQPRFHAIRPGVISSERVFRMPVELVEQFLEVARSKLNVGARK